MLCFTFEDSKDPNGLACDEEWLLHGYVALGREPCITRSVCDRQELCRREGELPEMLMLNRAAEQSPRSASAQLSL